MDHINLIKLICAIWIFVYWKTYGASTFIWISDATLLMLFIAVIYESHLIASMTTLTIVPEILLWCLPFWVRALFGIRTIAMLDYMFDPNRSISLRLWSLGFHTLLPISSFYIVSQYGYDAGAFICESIFIWILFIVARCFTDRADNVNLVFSSGSWIYRGIALNLIMWMTHKIWMKYYPAQY